MKKTKRKKKEKKGIQTERKTCEGKKLRTEMNLVELEQELTNLSVKSWIIDSVDHTVSCNNSILLSQHESSYRQYQIELRVAVFK